MKFWCKIFNTRQDIVAAICDEDILEKELKHENAKIKISKDFYGGSLINETAAVNIMKKVSIGNIIGKKIVDIAKDNGFITDENVIFIEGVPHAQFLKV